MSEIKNARCKKEVIIADSRLLTVYGDLLIMKSYVLGLILQETVEVYCSTKITESHSHCVGKEW